MRKYLTWSMIIAQLILQVCPHLSEFGIALLLDALDKVS